MKPFNEFELLSYRLISGLLALEWDCMLGIWLVEHLKVSSERVSMMMGTRIAIGELFDLKRFKH